MQIAPQAPTQDPDQQARELAAARLAEYLAGQPENSKRQPRRRRYKGLTRSFPEFRNEFFTRFLRSGKVSPILIDHALWQEFRAWLRPDHPAQSCIVGLRKSRRICLEEFRRQCAACRTALSSNHPLTLMYQPPYTKLSRWVRERLPEKSVIKLLTEWGLPQDSLTVDILEWYILMDELPIEDGGKSGASPCYPTIKPWGGRYRAMIRFFRLPSHMAIRQIFQPPPAPSGWKNLPGKKRRKTDTRFIDETSDFVVAHERQFEFPPNGVPEVIVNDGKQHSTSLVMSADVSFHTIRNRRCRCHQPTAKEAIEYYEKYGKGLGDCSCGGACPYFDRQFGRCFATKQQKVRWMRQHKIALEIAPGAIQRWCPPLEGDEPEGWIWLPKPRWKYADIIKSDVWQQVVSASERLPGPDERLRWGKAKQVLAQSPPEEDASWLDYDMDRARRRMETRYRSARKESLPP